ncbi:uncharacterized protein TNCV_913551 [Trichonephila clavipes]|nr:uncharacterized protein TNCV_913551 [Trichonephila clavipes]
MLRQQTKLPHLSEANTQVYVETPLHPEKLTVWCALWAGGIIGPYFFKNDEGHNVTVNGDRYRAKITKFFIPELNNHDVQELWFQQDGATCHTARATIDLLKDTFVIGLYADKPQTLDHLKDNIRRVIADIQPQMLEKSHRKLDVQQVNKRNRSLDQLTFRIALARQLTDGYSLREKKGRPASFQAKYIVVLDVNGDRYRAMITNFFIPELNNHDVQELWFQQDGATCHTARATIDLLKDTLGDRLISRFEPVNWPQDLVI